jgi:hypothetical protein
MRFFAQPSRFDLSLFRSSLEIVHVLVLVVVLEHRFVPGNEADFPATVLHD